MSTVISSIARTPIGKFRKAFSSLSAADLGSIAMAGALERAGITGDAIDEVQFGHVIRATHRKQFDQARERLEGTISQVDIKIFNSPMVSQSKYSKEYAKNVLAIERLVQAIKAHPMNEGSEIDGRAVRQYLLTAS